MGWAKPLKKLLYALPAPAFWLGVWQLSALWVDQREGGTSCCSPTPPLC